MCLKTWTTHNLDAIQRLEHICRNCIRKRYSSKAGKAGGAKAVTTGQIKQFVAAAALPAARDKARRTSRAKGHSAFTSKAEDAVYEKCVEWFGTVKRWHYITRSDGKRCSIDLYVPSIDTWIEVDGVYWHGLDKPYDQLAPEQRGKFDHDRVLDEHCKNVGIRLIRVTDREVTSGRWDEIRQKVTPYKA